jgi:hypothetical protein
MLNRILSDPDYGKPVLLTQDFLRSDYARIHTAFQLDDLAARVWKIGHLKS